MIEQVFSSETSAAPSSEAGVAASSASAKSAAVGATSTSSTGCGTVMANTGTGLVVASGFVALIPGVGEVLGPVLGGTGAVMGLMGTSAGNACIENQIDNINAQLAVQEQQIENIAVVMELDQIAFYQQNYQNAVNIAAISQQTYENVFGELTSNFATFMQDAGLWTLANQPISGASLQNSTLQQMTQVNPDPTSQALFRNWLENISGAFYKVGSCSEDCYRVISGTNPAGSGAGFDSALVATFNSLAVSLQAGLVANLEANLVAESRQNLIPLYDGYNQTLVSLYQQSLYALQQALMTEYSVNQMNYYYAANAGGSCADVYQIESYGGVIGTYYRCTATSYDASTEAAAYNVAQKQLTLMYVARVNQLFLNTLSWIVSDAPVAPQAYPMEVSQFWVNGQGMCSGGTTPGQRCTDSSGCAGGGTCGPYEDSNPIDYAAVVGSALPVSPEGGLPASTPLKNLPDIATAAGNTWSPTGILYQFSEINDAQTCVKSLTSYLKNFSTASGNSCGGGNEPCIQNAYAGPTACPPLFTTSTGEALDDAWYDGSTLQPYFVSSDGPVLSGQMVNNLLLCDATNPELSWYDPSPGYEGNVAGLVSGTSYLKCGNYIAPTATTPNCLPNAACPADWWIGPDSLTGGYPIESGYYQVNPNGAVTSGGIPGAMPAENYFTYGRGTEYSWGVAYGDVAGCPNNVIGSPWTNQGNLLDENYLNDGPGCSLFFDFQKGNFVWPATFGFRMPNGFVMPLVVQISTTSSTSVSQELLASGAASIASGAGYECSGVPSSEEYHPGYLSCTFLDGSVYQVSLAPYDYNSLNTAFYLRITSANP